MRAISSHNDVIGRRSELLAELFLQELEPKFLSRPTHDLGFDFLVGFANHEGGVNTFAVEVKGTDRAVSSSIPVNKASYRRLVNSNVPGFLLAVDVKQNRIFYAWPKRGDANLAAGPGIVNVPITEINDETKSALRKRLRLIN